MAGQQLLDAKAREVLRKQIWQVADFCGMELLTYCVMSNHLHLLIRVPEKVPVPPQEIARRWAVLYRQSSREESKMTEILSSGSPYGEKLRLQLEARMGLLSNYLKELKQRFSIYFNKSKSRFGTLWAERFKSIVVEDHPDVLRTVAGYIALNPVRSGLCRDPKDYRWSGYAEAVAGSDKARRGLMAALGGHEWRPTQAQFRVYLFGSGAAPRSGKARLGTSQMQSVHAAQGELTIAEKLNSRLRYFTDGAVLGTALFLDGFIDDHPQWLPAKRPRPPHPLNQEGWPNLSVLRRRGPS